MPGLFRTLSLGASLILAAALVLLTERAWAEGSCDALIAKATRAGEMPSVSIDAGSGTVELRTSQGICRETAATWSARRLPVETESGGTRVQQGIRGGNGVQESAPHAPISSSPKACDRKVSTLWKPTWVRFQARDYWLERVYTIDFNGDGRTDNIGFRFQPSTDGEKPVKLAYFATGGEVGAADLPELRIEDDRAMERICFGNLRLEKPVGRSLAAITKMPAPRITPDLERQATSKLKEQVRRKDRPMETTESESMLWAGLGGTMGGLLLLFGLFAWITRKGKGMSKRRGPPVPSQFADEYEYEPEPDD